MPRLSTLALASLVVAPVAAQAQNSIGCYQVQVEPWEPAMSLGGDTVFIAPPRVLHLLPLSAEDSLKQAPYARGTYWHPATESPKSEWRTPRWIAREGKREITIEWSNGFSGFGVKLKAKGDTLRGVAETFWDFGRPAQKAQFKMWRADCDGT